MEKKKKKKQDRLLEKLAYITERAELSQGKAVGPGGAVLPERRTQWEPGKEMQEGVDAARRGASLRQRYI